MSKVNQLLEKALSTNSEDEAIACLRLARKRHTGEAVTVDSGNNNSLSELVLYERLKTALDRGTYFMNEMTQERINRNKYEMLYERSKRSEQAWKVLAIGMTVCFAIVFTFIVTGVLFG